MYNVCIIGVSRTMDIPSVENLLNRRPDGWNSPQSPDELVIQKRGRRRSIVWSPDLDANKRNNLLRYMLYCVNLCKFVHVIKSLFLLEIVMNILNLCFEFSNNSIIVLK